MLEVRVGLWGGTGFQIFGGYGMVVGPQKGGGVWVEPPVGGCSRGGRVWLGTHAVRARRPGRSTDRKTHAMTEEPLYVPAA